MRPVSYFVACSLDGYIAGTDGGIGWLFTDADYGYRDFYDSVDTLLMGRITFDKTREWNERWPGKEVLVFSRLQTVSPVPEARFVSASPCDAVKSLKGKEGKKIWLVGGFGLAASLLRERLVDELVLSVHPVTLGAGIPLFPNEENFTQWRLMSAQAFDSGLVQLTYTLKKQD